MDLLIKVFKSVRSGPIPVNELTKLMLPIVGTAIIYGSPTVISAMGEWRERQDPQGALMKIDRVLWAIRTDLGESNKGIEPLDLLGLFITGGRPALEKGIKSMPAGDVRGSK